MGTAHLLGGLEGAAHLHLYQPSFGVLDVLLGPLIFPVLPVYPVSLLWRDPFPGDLLQFCIQVRGQPGTELRPEESLLQLADGTLVPPGIVGDVHLFRLPPLHSQESLDVVLTYEVPEGTTTARLQPRILVQGQLQTFAPLTLRRTSTWSLWQTFLLPEEKHRIKAGR